MIYCVGWDPSIARIGYCTWGDGKLILDLCGTMNRPEKITNFAEQLLWVQGSVFDFYRGLGCYLHGKEYDPLCRRVHSVAIEDFNKHSEHPTFSLLRLAASQGVIHTVSTLYSNNVVFQCKGSKGKAEAQTLAKHAGLPVNRAGVVTDHLADAYYVGLMAGFSRG